MYFCLMQCSGCFISYNAHYLKNSGNKTETLRWMTMIQRWIHKKPQVFDATPTFLPATEYRSIYWVSRWPVKLQSSYQFLAKCEIWVLLWLWVMVLKSGQKSVVAQSFDIYIEKVSFTVTLLCPLWDPSEIIISFWIFLFVAEKWPFSHFLFKHTVSTVIILKMTSRDHNLCS